MKSFKLLTYYLLISIGIVFLINIISNRFFFRLDWTEDDRYTLSDATITVLENLNEPVTIKAYFSGELPPNLVQAKNDFSDMLVEYASLSNGMVQYEFIDPSEDDEKEKDAQQAGLPTLQVPTREKDKIQIMNCFAGAQIQMGEQQAEIIPQIIEGMPIEYQLTSAIKKLSIVDKPSIGFLQGHGEPSLSAYQQALAQLQVLYNVMPVSLTDTTSALDAYETLVIVAPTDSFSQTHLQQLDDFIAKGKNLFVGINRVTGDFQQGMGSLINTGLESWLLQKGISVSNDFVLDASCGKVGVVQNMGGYRMQQQVPFPYIPIVKIFDNEHPVSKGIEAAIFQFASSLYFTGDSTVNFTPLAFTSEQSSTQNAPVYFNVQKRWGEADFPKKRIPIAGAFEGNIVGNMPSKMVVFTDGDFAVNGEGQAGQQINPDNVSLLVNSIDWLSDDTGLIDLRTKGVTARPIDELEDSTKTLLKWLNFLLPIILIVIYGLIRWQVKNNLRLRRMQSGYVK